MRPSHQPANLTAIWHLISRLNNRPATHSYQASSQGRVHSSQPQYSRLNSSLQGTKKRRHRSPLGSKSSLHHACEAPASAARFTCDLQAHTKRCGQRPTDLSPGRGASRVLPVAALPFVHVCSDIIDGWQGDGAIIILALCGVWSRKKGGVLPSLLRS